MTPSNSEIPFPIIQIRREDPGQILPEALWNIRRPPREIYLQGKPSAFQLLEKLPSQGLAIVGSRRMQPRSSQLIGDILTPLQGFDWVIVSGLAKGIDAAAHEWALKLGFPTIGILGCGLGLDYPVENRGLRRRIIDEGGLVISELPPDHEPLPWTFIHRNRLIAGWTRATWVVQAGFRSGALNTANWALQNERSIFSTPAFPGDPTLIGNQRLLSRGFAKCVWGSQSFGEVWLEMESFLSEKLGKSWREPLRESKGAAQCSSQILEKMLLAEVARRTAQEGGTVFIDLLSWAMELGFSPKSFFEATQRLTHQKRWLHLDDGLLRLPTSTQNAIM